MQQIRVQRIEYNYHAECKQAFDADFTCLLVPNNSSTIVNINSLDSPQNLKAKRPNNLIT